MRTIPSCDFGQRIPCFDSCQLTMILTYVSLNTGYRISYQLENVTFDIGFPVVRTDGRTDVRPRDHQNFSDAQITKFSYPRCSAENARAPLKIRHLLGLFLIIPFRGFMASFLFCRTLHFSNTWVQILAFTTTWVLNSTARPRL